MKDGVFSYQMQGFEDFLPRSCYQAGARIFMRRCVHQYTNANFHSICLFIRSRRVVDPSA